MLGHKGSLNNFRYLVFDNHNNKIAFKKPHYVWKLLKTHESKKK